jgi:hypothetical protein
MDEVVATRDDAAAAKGNREPQTAADAVCVCSIPEGGGRGTTCGWRDGFCIKRSLGGWMFCSTRVVVRMRVCSRGPELGGREECDRVFEMEWTNGSGRALALAPVGSGDARDSEGCGRCGVPEDLDLSTGGLKVVRGSRAGLLVGGCSNQPWLRDGGFDSGPRASTRV